MSSSYISARLRQQVALHAHYLCEYCLIHEEDTHFGCQVDHIISEKHGGPTTSSNLAYACTFCNRNKGSDVGSIIWPKEYLRDFLIPVLNIGLNILDLMESKLLHSPLLGSDSAHFRLEFN